MDYKVQGYNQNDLNQPTWTLILLQQSISPLSIRSPKLLIHLIKKRKGKVQTKIYPF